MKTTPRPSDLLHKVLTIITLIGTFTLVSGMKPLGLPMSTGNKIIGTWFSAEKDLKIEINQKNDAFFGKIVWFACEPQTPDMHAFKDTQNPDPKLRERKWLGMNVLENLTYNNKGYWSDGKIYDPNSGITYSSTVRLTSDNIVSVKGYWGIELIGKNLEFHRVN
jgi:uncharacterized protein (DUF2147 family)